MMSMIGLRSAVFYAYLVAVSALFLPLTLLSIPMPHWAWPLTRGYLRALLYGLKRICRLGYRVEGMENLPSAPCLIASSQQSTWENIAFPLLFGNPAIWVKSELYRVPVAGWIARANDHIPTDRSGELGAARAGMEKAQAQFRNGRSILIFSEGTRSTTPGQAALKKGTGVLYTLLECPCAPVVLDSGQYWGHGRYRIGPGTIRVQVLPAIERSLPRHQFDARLKNEFDEGASRLRDPER